MSMKIGFAALESPIGSLLVASTQNGLCFLEFGTDESATASFQKWVKKWHPEVTPVHDEPMNEQVIQQLQEYFAKTRSRFDVKLDLYGTEFQKSVWRALTEIPFGMTKSYKEVAEAVGNAKAVRAVGGANNKNPIPIIIPCHRVIGTNGSMVGYGGGLSIKEFLLTLENAQLKQSVV